MPTLGVLLQAHVAVEHRLTENFSLYMNSFTPLRYSALSMMRSFDPMLAREQAAPRCLIIRPLRPRAHRSSWTVAHAEGV